MIALLPKPSDLNQVLDFSILLAKHGYSASGYQAVVQEAVAAVLAQLPLLSQTEHTRTLLVEEVQNLLLRTAFTRLAPATLVLEQLKKYLSADRPLTLEQVTVFLLEQLGPLYGDSFYHSQTPPMLVEVF